MTKAFRIVVCPTDFSDCSQMAIHYALDMVAPSGRVVVCHVVDDVPLTYGYVGLTLPPTDIRGRISEDAEAELRAFIPVLDTDVTVDTRILHGSPAAEIVKLAHEEGAELLVMGTHGRTGFQHALLGSVAEKVVRRAPCPVLVIRSGGAGLEE